LWNEISQRAILNHKLPLKPDAMGIIWSEKTREKIRSQKLSLPQATEILSNLHLVLADAFIACWDTKYANRVPRPYMLGELETIVPTPPHPSWPSGHATASEAAAVLLSYYFPKDKKQLHATAAEAAASRLWGGIHFRKDNLDGLKLGNQIGHYGLATLKQRQLIHPFK
jgi:hypothetical protein